MINDSEELVDAVSDPKSDPSSDRNVANYTTNGNFPQNLLMSRFVPKIIQGAIGPINQLVTEGVTVIQDILGSHNMVLPKVSVAYAARSGTRIFWTPGEVSSTGRDGSTSRDVNSAVATARLNPLIPNSNPNSVSPARNGNQYIVSPRRSIIATKVRNVEPLNASINIITAVHGHSTSAFSKVIGH